MDAAAVATVAAVETQTRRRAEARRVPFVSREEANNSDEWGARARATLGPTSWYVLQRGPVVRYTVLSNERKLVLEAG